MRVFIGVGATVAQEFPFLVLKHTLLQHNPEHELIVESICESQEYKEISSRIEATYGTVFSLQRFLVPRIAKRHNADICMHLDSDMTCHRSLQPFFDLVTQHSEKIVLPEPNPNYKQPQQTAVFGCCVQDFILDLFDSNLEKFLRSEISYIELMRLSFTESQIFKCSYVFNSRELFEQETVILHVTDLYRQPWVNRFNSLKTVWLDCAKSALEKHPEWRKILIEGVKKGYYLPSLIGLVEPIGISQKIKDFFFLPPQFNAYAAQKFGIYYKKKYTGLFLKLVITAWVQAVACWHNVINHRLI